MKKVIQFILFILLFEKCWSNKDAPRITLPKDTIKSIEKGKHLTITCEAYSGTPPLHFEWKVKNQVISVKDHDEMRIEKGKYTSTFSIDNVEENHSGNYTCIVSNQFGSDNISVTLNVQVSPKFDKVPKDKKVGLGKKVEFYCSALGYPEPKITWNKLSNQVAESSQPNLVKLSPKLTLSNDNYLIIDQAKINDTGTYECLAQNLANGLSIRHTFTLIVNVAPYLNKKSSLVTAKRGTNAVLVCETFGATPVKVIWKKVETDNTFSLLAQHSNARIISIEKDFSNNNNKTTFELHIKTVQPNDNGVYFCKVFNDFGEDEKKITLTIQDIPSAVEDVKIEKLWSRSASIRWSPPKHDGNSVISRYIIQYWKENTTSINAYRLYEDYISSSFQSYQITDKLSPGTSYVIRIIAENILGRGDPSKTVHFETKEEEPSAAPVDINIESKGTTALKIKWKAPLKNHWNGKLKGYYIGYKEIKEDNLTSLGCNRDEKLYSWKDVSFIGQMKNNYYQEYLLKDLSKAGEYCLVIRAYNEQGNGPLSQPIIASTSNHDPTNPPSLRVILKKETSLVIKWEESEDEKDLNHYVLFYKDDEQSSWFQIAFPKSDNNQYELTNLQPSTWYKLYMKSIGKRGSSEPSSVVRVKTAGESNEFVSIESNQERLNFEKASKKVPLHFSSLLFISIIIAATIVVIVCAVAYAYIKYQEKKVALIQAGYYSQGSGKSFHYISTNSNPSGGQTLTSEDSSITLRYHDVSDKSKPLLARPSVPNILYPPKKSIILEEDQDFISPYDTLIHKNSSSLKLPPPLPKTRPPVQSSDKEGPNSLLSNNPCASSNVYFKADVHCDDGHVYDHFKSHRV